VTATRRPVMLLCRSLAQLLGVAVVAVACHDPRATVSSQRHFAVSSVAFTEDHAFPAPFTCDGADKSPPLAWDDVAAADGYVVVMVDEDADDFVHWVVFDIAPSITELGAGRIPRGATEGRNDFGDAGYGGPCPPRDDDAHHYVLTVYAVSEAPMQELAPGAPLGDVLDAIDCCVEASGSITAEYARPGRTE
jgi:Raf kinase inhibitor-like YbhB/YbcL family protein